VGVPTGGSEITSAGGRLCKPGVSFGGVASADRGKILGGSGFVREEILAVTAMARTVTIAQLMWMRQDFTTFRNLRTYYRTRPEAGAPLPGGRAGEEREPLQLPKEVKERLEIKEEQSLLLALELVHDLPRLAGDLRMGVVEERLDELRVLDRPRGHESR
jgi:hypothetical protein